jgi:hypothetical protein
VDWGIGGLVDWWIGGLVDWWIGGLVDWWIGGLVDWWIGRLVDWSTGRLDCRISEERDGSGPATPARNHKRQLSVAAGVKGDAGRGVRKSRVDGCAVAAARVMDRAERSRS